MDPFALLEQAAAAHRRGEVEQAETLYLQLLEAHPGHPVVSHLLGGLRAGQGRREEALDLMLAALAARPDDARIMLDISNLLLALDRSAEALAICDRALAIRPDYFEALNNRGNALRELGRIDEALASLDAALQLRPDAAPAWCNRALALVRLKRTQDALDSYDRALAIDPDYIAAITGKGGLLQSLERSDEALALYGEGLARHPGQPDLLLAQAYALVGQRRFAEALPCYEQLLAAEPRFPKALSQLAWAALNLCDWARVAAIAPRLADVAGAPDFNPLTLVAYSQDGGLQRDYARAALRVMVPFQPAPLWTGRRYGHRRIRIAYLSADFRAHPVAFQVSGVLEQHDRSRFETIGLAFNRDDGSAPGRRMKAALEQVHDVSQLSMRGIAEKLRALEADIVVELGGHTADSCLAALSYRPCPVAATWLGYPGTSGADFVDYIIGDAIVTPFEAQSFYSERIVQLPGSFFPAETPAIGRISRAEAGLPETGFVFCCFNNSWKLTAPVWAIWMRLLAQVEGSVLWLRYGDAAAAPLQRAMQAHGLDPSRLVFAGAASSKLHLARFGLADLFLDTLPYNAHATAAEALWAGLPVLTQLGGMFAGRVAASLLTAVGLPELITRSAAEYESMALALARDPARLQALKDRLTAHKASASLFDKQGFARKLEAAYAAMLEKETPQAFAVSADAVRPIRN